MRLLRPNALEAVLSSRFYVHECSTGQLLLACQLWLQIYVSIVNRSIGYLCSYIRYFTYDLDLRFYGEYMTYDVLLIFPRFFDKCKCKILYDLCSKDALHDLIKIHAQFEWSHDDVRSGDNGAFRCACEYGRLDVAKWLFTVFQLTVDDVRTFENHAFRWACAEGHLDVAQWLYTVLQLTIDDIRISDNRIFRAVCYYGCLNVAEWLYKTFQLTVDDVRSNNNVAYKQARQYGNKDVRNWLVATFGESVTT